MAKQNETVIIVVTGDSHEDATVVEGSTTIISGPGAVIIQGDNHGDISRTFTRPKRKGR